MKPHLRFERGVWWCGPRVADYYLWACCAPSVRQVCKLYRYGWAT